VRIDWSKDYYAILQVPKFSSFDELKKSYRKLAKQFHPDINPGNKNAEDRFKEITNAYDILSDSENKTIYDNYLRNPQSRPYSQGSYDPYQEARRRAYEEFTRQQQYQWQRQEAERRRQATSGAPEPAGRNFDISPWQIIFIIIILMNILRTCSRMPVIP
jgi:curved DNA-binding protein CbpA